MPNPYLQSSRQISHRGYHYVQTFNQSPFVWQWGTTIHTVAVDQNSRYKISDLSMNVVNGYLLEVTQGSFPTAFQYSGLRFFASNSTDAAFMKNPFTGLVSIKYNTVNNTSGPYPLSTIDIVDSSQDPHFYNFMEIVGNYTNPAIANGYQPMTIIPTKTLFEFGAHAKFLLTEQGNSSSTIGTQNDEQSGSYIIDLQQYNYLHFAVFSTPGSVGPAAPPTPDSTANILLYNVNFRLEAI